ncbi:peptidyl-prolyl cis-trans isomerase sig-7 [Drosophila suzukii]|uniref:Peptidyl-prolyl cis-trans isomerase n=1 Tax=Drosophila suzukii TaxID=28584 RepID=A0AB39ZBB0_DROSZ
MSVVIETTLGDLTVDLFTSERPIACLNFLKLCRLKYYNFNLFHTVQQGFIAQTGDPSGAGDGGSSIWGVVEGMHKRFFEAEYLPRIHHSSAGMLSLVSAGKNLVGSQFFFTLGENLSSLDGSHCVIGEVVEGHEVLRKLNDAIVDENFRPYQDIRITHTVVLEDPFPNPRGLQAPSRSPSPSAERLKNGRIAADEDIDDTDGMTMEELQEMMAEREAKARATILEIVGDLPDADMAPPENVLFVCKLNPVTTDDDLEIIFSRFGVVKGCEVIRDRKTGDSLQYAFVEFEDQKSCEAAYFKMDNVLIDDRRIHVDFSQSVSKVTWRGKGRGIVGDEDKLDFDNLRDNNDRRKPNNGRGRKEDRDPKRTEDARSRLGSAERRKAREQRHQEQSNRDDRKNVRRRSRSREQKDRRRSRSRHSDNGKARENFDRNRFNDRERNRNERRPSRSRDLPQRIRSRSRDRAERRRSRSRDQTDRRRSRSREPNERRRSRPRDQVERKRSRSRDRYDSRRVNSPQDRKRHENGGAPYKETVKNNKRSPERRRQSRDRDEKKKSPERKRKNSVEKSKKQDKKKSKRAPSTSSDTSESSSESESDSDSTSSESSEDSSSSDERSKRKKSKKSKQKSKSKSSHKSKKKHRK